jgi:hypothetical protein
MLQLAVDTTSDPKEIKTAIQELRNLARMGRFAQHVLDTIDRQGYYDGKVKGLPLKPKHMWQGHILSQHALKKMRPILREDMPSFLDLQIHFGEIRTESHGGSKFPAVPLIMSGTIYNYRTAGYVKGKSPRNGMRYAEKMSIGMLRLKSTGYSIDPSHKYGHYNGGVFPVYAADTPNAQEAFQEMSKLLASAVFRWQSDENQFSHDMRIAVAKWLHEEKHVFRLCSDIRRDVKVLKLMKE